MKPVQRGRLLPLPRTECLARLGSTSVGRLGVTIRALPAILPVNHLLHGDAVVIRSVAGSKLDAATAGAVVAFDADDHAADGSWGWSVLVQGVAEEVTDPDEVAALQELPLAPWAFAPEPAHRFLRIATELVSGRRFGMPPPASA